MSKKYRLKALEHFICIGSDCPDSCCKRHWDIEVDKETYNKWQALDNSNLSREMLVQNVTTHRRNNEDIYYLKKDGNNHCFHLDQAGLCSIQSQLGVNMMPFVCCEYPRKQHKSKKREIYTATPSCPEIARLVLFSEDEPVYDIKGGAQSPLGKGLTAEKLYWYLEKVLNNIFAANDFALNIKLTYLARVLAEITMLGEQGVLDDKSLKSFSYDHQLHMDGLQNAVLSGEFATSPANARYMWHVIVNELAKQSEFNQRHGLNEPIEELLDIYKKSNGSSGENDPFVNRIQAYKQHAQPKLKCYENALNRYLQAVFILNDFPHRRGSYGYIDAFLLSVIPFATAQLFSWLHIEKHQEISEEELIAIIAGIESLFGHSTVIMDYVEKNKSFYRLELYFDWFLDLV